MLYIVGKIPTELKRYLEDRDINFGQFISMTPQPLQPYMVPVDMQSPAALKASLEGLHADIQPTALLVAGYEQYVIPAAYIAAFYGLAGSDIAAAEASTDKFYMRGRLPSDIVPHFAEANSIGQAIAFATKYGYPVMLKPTNLMKSLLIQRCDDELSLRAAYSTIINALPALRSKHRVMQPTSILIEQYMTGSMHTVAGFVSHEGTMTLLPQISDCLTARDIGSNDTYLFSRATPSLLSAPEQAAILRVAEAGVIALGIQASPVHVEIMVTPNGPKIIEIGSRLGGYRPHMYKTAFGIDMYGNALATASGRPLNIKPLYERHSAVIELFADQTGEYVALENEKEIQALPSFNSLHIKAHESKIVGPAREGYKAAAIIFLESSRQSELQSDITTIRQRTGIISRPLADMPNK